jgi:hypothetical protein
MGKRCNGLRFPIVQLFWHGHVLYSRIYPHSVKLRGCITATLAVLHASVVGGVGSDFRTPMPCLNLDFRALFDWRWMGSLQKAREQRISTGAHSRGEGSRA